MRTISLKLQDGLDRKLASAAKARGTTKSNVVRTALESFLDDDSRHRKGSCLDLAGDLFGSVEGPADLSVNQKYMEGFGR